MNVDAALQRLQAAEVQQLPLASLKTDDALQPREARMVPFREQTRTENASENHVGTMRLVLEAASHIELEPVLVADVAGVLYVVDGHHRLKAYRRVKRETIPARVLPMKFAGAVIVSKLVNCTDRALKMHAEQCLDAAWQYLAAVTNRGASKLPVGESLRIVAARFGIGKDTVRTMLKQLPTINPKDWSTEAHDPGTNFPRWRYVRESKGGWHGMNKELDVEQLTQLEAEKLAKKIGALMDKATPEAVRRAVQMLGIEAALEASNPDTLAFTEETAEDGDF